MTDAAQEAEVQEKSAIQAHQYFCDKCSWCLLNRDAPLMLGGPGVCAARGSNWGYVIFTCSRYNVRNKTATPTKGPGTLMRVVSMGEASNLFRACFCHGDASVQNAKTSPADSTENRVRSTPNRITRFKLHQALSTVRLLGPHKCPPITHMHHTIHTLCLHHHISLTPHQTQFVRGAVFLPESLNMFKFGNVFLALRNSHDLEV